jgi:predicted  nucleic acid-binding Zn-ribbon protein
LELQKFDLQLDALEEQGQSVKERVQKLAGEVQKEDELAKSKEALQKKILLRQKKAESEMEVHSDKIRVNEVRMNSAGMSPDTYRALEKEVAAGKELVSQLESKILEDMDKLEFLKGDLEKARKVLLGRQHFLEEVRKKAHGELAEISGKKEHVLTLRRQASLKIPGDQLEPYEELRAKNKGRIIWDAETPFCPACGMSLPPGFVRTVAGTPHAENCPNCSLLIRWTGMDDGAHVN